jgi:aminoglycoside phosphotransferase (APT) family kinase protein
MKSADLTPAVVARLIAAQFPQWAYLPVVSVAFDGWDNTTVRRRSSRRPMIGAGAI